MAEWVTYCNTLKSADCNCGRPNAGQAVDPAPRLNGTGQHHMSAPLAESRMPPSISPLGRPRTAAPRHARLPPKFFSAARRTAFKKIL
jgi:hypothetical protein